MNDESQNDYIEKLSIHHILNVTAMVELYSPYDKENLTFSGLGILYDSLMSKTSTIYPITSYESEHFKCKDLASGFCAVLMNWALWEVICNLQKNGRKLHGHENDLNFNYKAMISVQDLFQKYTNASMFRYRESMRYDPNRQKYLETDDTLVSKIYFDEWAFFSHLIVTGLFDDLSNEQQNYFADWWFAFERYMRTHYHIKLSTEDMIDRDRVLENMYHYGLIRLPYRMSIKQFINDHEWTLELFELEKTENVSKSKNSLDIEIKSMQQHLAELQKQVRILSEQIVDKKTPLKDLLPKENDYVGLVEWLMDQKIDGHDYYKEAHYNRSKMCRNISPIVGWIVDQNSLRKAQGR